MAIGHIGSWGLPEFGITERIGSLFGAPTTQQGGSNISALFGSPGGMNVSQSLSSPIPSFQYGSPAVTGQQPVSTQPVYSQPVSQPSGSNLSLRQQMEQGLIPWDDNLLAQSGGGVNDTYRQEQEGLINQKWNAYFAELDRLLSNYLPEQKAIQEQIAAESYGSSKERLESQKESQKTALETTQKKSLRDLSGNIANLMQAGQTYLGARGAGDSSAANMYSYALTKLGTQQRGNILSEVNARRNRIDDIYTDQLSQLESQKNTAMMQIASWFSQAQQQAREMKARGELDRGSDLQNLSTQLYNQALSQINMINQDYVNRKNALYSWAAQNAVNLDNALQVINQIGSTFQPVSTLTNAMPNVTPEGQYTAPVGYGGVRKPISYDVYGNPIYS